MSEPLGLGHPREFWFARGPFLNGLRRLRLTRTDGTPRTWMLVAIAWLPLCFGALLRFIAGESQVPIIRDVSVHTRLLVAVPLLIMGERLLAERCRGAVMQLYNGEFAHRRTLDRIIDCAERMRDSRVVVFAIGALALIGGQLTLWGAGGATGLISGGEDAGALTFARIWYAIVAQPLVTFLAVRWLWQWLIWSVVVVRVARVKLATLGSHPDHAGGIGFMAGPIGPFSTFVMALATLLAGAWATELIDARAIFQSFIPGFVALVISAVVVACGPQFAFMPALYRERLRSIRAYNDLGLRYMRAFQDKWVEPGDKSRDASLLGVPDIQSLNDLIGAYEGVVRVRLVPFGTRHVLYLWGAAAVPMIPLALTAMPIEEVLTRLGKILFGFVA